MFVRIKVVVSFHNSVFRGKVLLYIACLNLNVFFWLALKLNFLTEFTQFDFDPVKGVGKTFH